MENRAFEDQQMSAKSPMQSMHQTLDNLQSTTQHIGHIANDRDNLVSPEKVHSTQNTLERRMKESQQYNRGNDTIGSPYSTIDSRKFAGSSDYQYCSPAESRIRYPGDNNSNERLRHTGIDSTPSYTITDRAFATDNSPAQYSSIERKINQETYDTTDKKQKSDETVILRSPLSKTYSPNYSTYERTFETFGPPPPPMPQMPRNLVSFNEQKSFDDKYSKEQKIYEEKSFEKRTFGGDNQQPEALDPKYFPGTTSDRFSGNNTMSTFKSTEIKTPSEIPRNYIATAGIPQSQTYKNVDSKVIPGSRVETITTKVYTSTPGKSTSSSNFETIEKKEFAASGNEMSTFKSLDNVKDSIEQRTIQKSTTQKVTEKKTVTMTMSSRQESNTKSFRFEDKLGQDK